MFFEGGGYKSRAGCHGALSVLSYVPTSYVPLRAAPTEDVELINRGRGSSLKLGGKH